MRSRGARWVDAFGPESPYDYDPVWAKCVELGVAPTFSFERDGFRKSDVSDQLRLQPYWQFRAGRRSDVPHHGDARRPAAIPRASMCLS